VHIAYLVQDFPPEVGAGPARVTEMSRRWQEQGARVTVITGMPNRRIPGRGEGRIDSRYRGHVFVEESWDGIRTLRSWVFASSSLGFAAKIVNNASFMVTGFAHALAKAGRPDVLIASSPPFLPHVSGALLAKRWRVPLVLEIRDLWPDYLVQMGVLKSNAARQMLFGLERWLLRQATRVVVVTDSFRERVAAKGIARERISVVPNGVDVERYMPAEPVETNGFRVGYLGTFGRGQGLLAVIDAAERLAAHAPDVHFTLVGDGPEREIIKDAIRARALTNVTVSPPIPRDETAAFYNSCNICLVPLAPIPIFQETIPSKIFEVMACGRPLIASLEGEGARILAESQGGLTTPPGDGAALAAAILRVRQMPAENRAQMGSQARAYVVKHYNRRSLSDEYLGILQSLVMKVT
jgi:glycosyltransferase involved in cell wall biosynthesis